MWTYCLLKDGREMVVWSDNTEEGTMHVFPVQELEDYDPEWIVCKEVKYSEVVRTDSNRVIAYSK